MQSVWTQCARVLRPNGKLCINAPIMPIPKAVIEQHTRHLKNIAFDIEHRILAETDLERYSSVRVAEADVQDDVRQLSLSGQHHREQHYRIHQRLRETRQAAQVRRRYQRRQRADPHRVARSRPAGLVYVPGGRQTRGRSPGAISGKAARPINAALHLRRRRSLPGRDRPRSLRWHRHHLCCRQNDGPSVHRH